MNTRRKLAYGVVALILCSAALHQAVVNAWIVRPCLLVRAAGVVVLTVVTFQGAREVGASRAGALLAAIGAAIATLLNWT